jgi:hypothetical protein
MQRNKPGYVILLVLTIIFALLAVSTLLPQETAVKACWLGYKAHCTFAPISTIILLACCAATCVVRSKLFST